MFHYTSCGLQRIWLKNGYTTIDTDYGEATSIHDLEGLHKAIGRFIINNKVNLCGGEIRFLRKELDLSQVNLAQFLGVSEVTVRGWEKNRTKITKPADRMLRLLYGEHADGNREIRAFVEGISQLNREIIQNGLELEETEEGWRQAA